MRLILKSRKAATLGAVHTYKDGRRYKKVAEGDWRLVAAGNKKRLDKDFYDDKAKKHLDSAYKLFTESTGKMSWAGIGIVEHLEEKYGIYDFEDLKKQIKGKPRDKASEIYRSTKEYIDSLTIDTGLKKVAVDRIGRALLALRDAYSGPKEKLMIKVPKTDGGVRYLQKEAPSAAFPATAVKSAQKKLGGWTDMSKLPDASQMRKLLKTGAAKKVTGRVQPKKKWSVRQLWKEAKVPYGKNSAGVTFRLRQSEKVKQRTKTVSEVALTIPYPYARQFINKQIESKRTRNFLVKQMENSAGYKSALGMKDTKQTQPDIEPRELPGPLGRVG